MTRVWRILAWTAWPIQTWLAVSYIIARDIPWPWQWMGPAVPWLLVASVFFHGYYAVSRQMGWLVWASPGEPSE
jgi:hypothetical protein